jgi:hypothetical protein
MNQELIDVIKNSNLSQEDKTEWESMVSVMPNEAAEVLLKTVKQGIMDVGKMNEFYQRKKEAVLIMKKDKAKGQEMLDAIYHEEAEMLSKLKE